jgi:hypothetical protein
LNFDNVLFVIGYTGYRRLELGTWNLEFGTWNFSLAGKACKNSMDEVQPRPNTVFALSPFRPFALQRVLEFGTWNFSLAGKACKNKPDEVQPRPNTVFALSPFRPSAGFGTWNLFVIWNLELGILVRQAQPVKINRTRCNLVQTPFSPFRPFALSPFSGFWNLEFGT